VGSADCSPKAIIEQLNGYYKWYTKDELELKLPPELSNYCTNDNKMLMPLICFSGYHCFSSEMVTTLKLMQIIEDQFSDEEFKLPDCLEFDLVNFKRSSTVDLRPRFGLAEVDFVEMSIYDHLRIPNASNFASVSQGIMIYIALNRYIRNIMGHSKKKIQIVMPKCHILDENRRKLDSLTMHISGYFSKPKLVPFLGTNFENTRVLYPIVTPVSI
jgi:hypothetical protein